MDALDTPPLTGATLDAWSAGLDDVAASVASVAAGLDPAELGRWLAADPTTPGVGFLSWRWDSRLGLGDAAGWTGLDAGRLSSPFDAEIAHRHQLPAPRLAVTGDVIPGEVVPRLLACPGVGSAVIPVERAPGALRRRAWHWPPRIGVAEDALVEAFAAQRGDGTVPPELVDVRDVRTDPGGVDILVLRESPAGAAAFVAARRQLAGVVVCAGEPGAAWPVVDAHLALVRAATGAVATAVVPADEPATVAHHVLRTLRYLAHAHPLDVALTAAFERRIVIAAETDALADATLPATLRVRARQHRFDIEAFGQAMGMPPAVGAEPPVEPPRMEAAARDRGIRALDRVAREVPALEELEALPDGAFDHESEEASRAVAPDAAVEAALDEAEAAVPRLLQARVGPFDGGPAPDNVLRPGANAVDVFIGPEEAGALLGRAVTDEQLGFDDPAVNRVRLTVVLAPLIPRGEPSRAELDVPRTGRSGNARLRWDLPETGRVQARLMVLHRNRVLQTALLTGRVGEEARLRERLVLWERLSHLDDRQPFDRTFVLNHDDDGRDAVVSHADGATTIEAMAEIDATTERIRTYLLQATQLTSTGDAAREAARRILIDVAVEGNDLYTTLEDHLAGFAGARRLQVVTARAGRFLPLEMVYDRPAPDPDAVMCANWEAGRECGPHCFSDEDDTTVVCPAVFWGMSRVIERHHTSLTDAAGTAFLVTATPTREQRLLTVSHAMLGASEKVLPLDLMQTRNALGAEVTPVTTWEEWVAALAATPSDLLVLMPHTDPAVRTMEIAGHTLRNGRVEKRHVTGGHEVHPVVVLFGCDTDGSRDDPAGFATRFMKKGAAVVFSTLTMLLARHAASMSQRLAAALRAPDRGEQPLGELVAAFRREAVRGGLISALAVTAYGDADWKV